jgi:hypothetical protein
VLVAALLLECVEVPIREGRLARGVGLRRDVTPHASDDDGVLMNAEDLLGQFHPFGQLGRKADKLAGGGLGGVAHPFGGLAGIVEQVVGGIA